MHHSFIHASDPLNSIRWKMKEPAYTNNN